MTQIRVLTVDTEGTAQHIEIGNDFRSFQAVVGGYIEGVYGNVGTIYVNEEGLLKDLPFNPFATEFANRILDANVRLFGTALIVGPVDDEGNDTHVRPSVVDYYTLEA